MLADLRMLYRLVLAPVRGGTHQERLESFYARQADDYDRFRERLLHGRAELYAQLPVPQGGVWIEMGGGTGANLERLGSNIARLRQVYVVDLASSLLRVARERVARSRWSNVSVLEDDASRVALPPASADVITFSYSLTMIPEWYRAVDHAWSLLKPGGVIAVVDFYVARKHPESGRTRQRGFTRTVWPWWFARDNVFLSADHLPYLAHRFQTEHVFEGRATLPYVPLLKVPYYRFVGRKAN